MSELNLLVNCDFPPKDGVTKISSTASVSDLRVAAAKALGWDEAVVERYLLFAVAYLSDVIDLSKAGSKKIGEAGVTDRSTIFFRAPADIKPQVKRRKRKEVDEKDKKDEVKDKYKGFNVKNALKKLEESKGPTRKLAMEYVDIYASQIVKQPGFKSLPKEFVVSIVKSDTLNIKEVELFEAVLEWGKAEAKRENKETDPETLKKVLADILPNIRFPIMSTQDVAVKVTGTKMLDSTQILQLFTYLGTQAPDGTNKGKLGDSLKMFPDKKRKGRLPPAWFKWDANRKHGQLTVSTDGLTVTSNTTSYYQPIHGDVELKEGVHEWECVLQTFYTNTYSVNIGVVPSTVTDCSQSHMIGYPGHMQGWAFACGHGQKYHQQQQSYGRVCTTGDVIRVRVDLDKGTLQFWVNGSDLGVAYTDVKGPVRPAMSLYGTNTVMLKFPQGQ